MILKKLFVYSLVSNALLKEYIFNDYGLNIILGEKRDDAKEANGSGKTSMVESFRYLLGSSRPKDFSNKPLLFAKDIFLVLQVIDDGRKLYLGRLINEPTKGYILKSETPSWNIKEWDALEDNEYKQLLDNLVFGNNKSDIDRPSYSALREYIIRDEKGGFTDIGLANRGAATTYKVLAFLCCLPFNYEKEIAAIKKQQQNLVDQQKQIDALTETAAELKIQERQLKAEIDHLAKLLREVNIMEKVEDNVQKYNNLKTQLGFTQNKLFELEAIKRQYEKNIENLEQKYQEILVIKDLKEFYNNLLEYFPAQLEKNYADIEQFYSFMVENRGKYFKGKIEALEHQIQTLLQSKKKMQYQISDITKIINSKDIVTDLTTVSEEIQRKNEELAKIQVKIEFYDKKNEINAKINKLKQDIITQTQIKHDEYQSAIGIARRVSQVFGELVSACYGEQGILEFEFNNKTELRDTTGRIKIRCTILDEGSHGRLYMKINMFDLSWFFNRLEMHEPINLLIHDGSYVKPDDKEAKFKLLKYAHEKLSEMKRGQYFITANVDELGEQDLEYFRTNDLVIARLDRKEGGENRFFGFKYSQV